MGIVNWWEKITPRWRIFEAAHLSLSSLISIWVGQIFLDPNHAQICPCARVFQSRVLTRPRAEKPTNRRTGRDSAEGLLGCGTDKKVYDLVPYFSSLFTCQTKKAKQNRSTRFVWIWICNIEIIAHLFDNVNGLSKICSQMIAHEPRAFLIHALCLGLRHGVNHQPDSQRETLTKRIALAEVH